MAITDVYDAVRSKRVYKPPISHPETCEIIQRDSGTRFDPALVEVFAGLQNRFDETWLKLQE